jgi:hypothetical protein
MTSRVADFSKQCRCSQGCGARLFSAFLATIRLHAGAERPSLAAGIRLLVGLILISGGATPLFSGDSSSGARVAHGVDLPTTSFLNQIQKAWHDREERVHSLKLIYVMNTFEPAEGRARMMKLQARRLQKLQRGNQAAKAPNESQPQVVDPGKFSCLFLFAFRGNRYRDEYWRTKTESEATALAATLNPGTGSEYAEILDGKIHFGLTPEGRYVAGSRFRQLGILSGTNQIASTATGALLLRLYHSADPALIGMNPTEESRLTLVPPHGTHPAALVVSLPRRELWLDPSRDYVITKEVGFDERHHPMCETDCEYQKAPPPLRWVPERWTTTCAFSDGTIRRRDENRVLSWTTGDAGVSENLFHFECPDGTFILDQSQKEGQLNKWSIMWHGVRFPLGSGRSYVESLELVKAATSE